MSRDYTDITVVLDRSGSMSSIKSDVIGGLKQFIKEQKKAGDNASLTLVQFDTSGTEYVYENTPIDRVVEDVPFAPRGGTPLLDALGETIDRTGARLRRMAESRRPDKVLFVVYTDGQENESRKFTKEQIKNMIEHQNGKYNWQFMYLGANQDAFAEARAMGIPSFSTYDFSAANICAAMDLASSTTATYRSSGSANSLNASPEARSKLVSNNAS